MRKKSLMEANNSLNTLMVTFFESLRKESFVSIKLLCMESHVSTRTYAKLKKNIPVKAECYHRLFIGIIRTTDLEDFHQQWQHLDQSLYGIYSE